MKNMNELSRVEHAASQQRDNACNIDNPNFYALSPEKLSRNREKIERRQFKNRISDRRSAMRLNVDGKAQPDRRRANRVAYAEMYSRLLQPR